MQSKCIFVALFAAFVAVNGQGGTGGCDGGNSEGQDVISGAYYYTCKGGQLQPTGCLSDTQQKIPIGQSYNEANIQKTCVLGSDGHLTTQCTGCVTNDGTTVAPGQSVDQASIYLTCAPNAGSYNLQVGGCLNNGQRVAIGDKATVSNQYMVCQQTSNLDAAFKVTGCVSNGKSYDIGSEVSDNTAFYHCDSNGNMEPVGCIANGQKVYDLDLFVDSAHNDVRRCRVDDTSVHTELFGCNVQLSDGTTEKKSVACTWETGSAPFYVVKCCIKDKNGGDFATTTDLYCLYEYNGGKIQVDEGCYRVFGDTAAGCKRQSDGTLQMQTFPAKDAGSNAFASGLHQCAAVASAKRK